MLMVLVAVGGEVDVKNDPAEIVRMVVSSKEKYNGDVIVSVMKSKERVDGEKQVRRFVRNRDEETGRCQAIRPKLW